MRTHTSSGMQRLITAIVGMAVLTVAAPLVGATQQPGDCRAGRAAPAGHQEASIGHFSEGADEVAEFCRYLIRARIWPSFTDLGSVADQRAVRRAHAALEAGTIDVLWVNSFAVGAMLSANRSFRMKVVAFTDFLVLHIGTRQPGVGMVTDAAFAPTEVAVRAGRSMYFADVLFGALRRRPRCLEATVGCTVLPGEGLAAGLDRFLAGGAGRTVVLASWALPPKGPDVVVRSLYAGPFHLVGVPAATVVSMQAVAGTMAFLQIPRGAYGPTQNSDVPAAAMTQMVVSSTPAEVLARVREIAHRLNDALFDMEPRINVGGDLPGIVEMTRRLMASVDGRLIYHGELARQLDLHGLFQQQDRPDEPQPPGDGGKY